MIKISLPLVLIILIGFVMSCKKPAGEGGQATIKGKLWVRDYNSDFSALHGEYAGYDEDVYIIYGDHTTYDDKTKTGPDGYYEFKYLRKGNYKIYTYSKIEYHFPSPEPSPKEEAIIQEVKISSIKEIVEAPLITVKK